MSAQNETAYIGEWVRETMRLLVDAPEAVEVSLVEGTQAVLIEVSVHADDIRRVVGRQGATLGSVRSILDKVGGREGRRFILDVREPSPRQAESPA